jgi:hypothetical protein
MLVTQALIAELYQITVPNINIHIRNIFKENELDRNSVVKEYLTTAPMVKIPDEIS